MALEALKQKQAQPAAWRLWTGLPLRHPPLRRQRLTGRFPLFRSTVQKTDSMRARHGVHFFIDDYLFERVWKDPAVTRRCLWTSARS